MKSCKVILSTIASLLSAACLLHGDPVTLEQGFLDPPDSAKPKTWFHVMSSNMTGEGLTKDLEAIADAGIGGIQMFNVTQRIPRGKVHYNTEEHRQLIQHAITEADRLGLTFDIHNCDGWSSSGGPWVTPEDSMKMVVWSQAHWAGGEGVIHLPQPTKRDGFYRDIAVLAYPSLESEIMDAQSDCRVTASDPAFEVALATDGQWVDSTVLKQEKEKAWIQFEYEAPFTARSMMVIHRVRDGQAELAYSEDGETWIPAGQAKTVRTGKGEWVNHDRFEPITARYFRILFPQPTDIKEITLSSVYPVENPLGRNALGNAEDINLPYMEEPDPQMIINSGSIINLTDALRPDGSLELDLLPGDWTLLRIGYTSTGAFNNPASPEGRGLECDKLDADAFGRHWEAFLSRVIEENPEQTGKTFQSVIIDSYEAGGQNWTQGFEETFRARHSYDLMDFLPVLTGRFVDSAKVTDGVLYDFRQVIGDLMVEEYYKPFTELCHENGLLSYIEPYGFGPLKDLDIGQYADVPMGEFWATRDTYKGLHAARSSANIYGKNIIAAESFTSHPEINWKGHPGTIKTQGDIAMTFGVNRFVFHRYAHQANTHVTPGMTMNTWGFHFDRTQTWWDSAGAAFNEYLARCSFLLQSGIPVADVALFEGDGAPASPLYKEDLTSMPSGFNFDNLNQDVLLHRLGIEGGKLVLPEGTSYRVLVLRPGVKIGMQTLLRLKQIAQAGIPIIGDPPHQLPGHGYSGQEEERYCSMVKELWEMDSVTPFNTLADTLEMYFPGPDMEIVGREDIFFIHRLIEDSHFYFFYNPDDTERVFTCRFRQAGKIPQLWEPVSGSRRSLNKCTVANGMTELKLKMEPNGSAFVVFTDEPDENIPVAPLHGPEPQLVRTIPVEGQWSVDFGTGVGSIDLPALVDWKDYSDENIRYFSGTATYSTKVEISSSDLHTDSIFRLELGEVEICARVRVNGKDLGVIWKKPFNVDIVSAVHSGKNLIEIEVTNLWANHLIGDERYPNTSGYTYPGSDGVDMPDWYAQNEPMPDSKRTTFTTAKFYNADDPLLPSGLLGPVRVQVLKK